MLDCLDGQHARATKQVCAVTHVRLCARGGGRACRLACVWNAALSVRLVCVSLCVPVCAFVCVFVFVPLCDYAACACWRTFACVWAQPVGIARTRDQTSKIGEVLDHVVDTFGTPVTAFSTGVVMRSDAVTLGASVALSCLSYLIQVRHAWAFACRITRRNAYLVSLQLIHYANTTYALVRARHGAAEASSPSTLAAACGAMLTRGCAGQGKGPVRAARKLWHSRIGARRTRACISRVQLCHGVAAVASCAYFERRCGVRRKTCILC